MPITDKMVRLGTAARKLNDGSDHLNRLISRIDGVLGRLMIGMDYIHPRPVSEQVTYDADHKRVIEIAYVGYLKIRGHFHLALKTVKVMESKAAMAGEAPGAVVPLLEAPRRLRYAAVDLLPEVVSGLATQVDDIVQKMERRCDVASALLDHLESMVEPGAPAINDPVTAERLRDIAEASGVHPVPVRHPRAPSPAEGAQPPRFETRRRRSKTDHLGSPE